MDYAIAELSGYFLIKWYRLQCAFNEVKEGREDLLCVWEGLCQRRSIEAKETLPYNNHNNSAQRKRSAIEKVPATAANLRINQTLTLTPTKQSPQQHWISISTQQHYNPWARTQKPITDRKHWMQGAEIFGVQDRQGHWWEWYFGSGKDFGHC